MQETLLYAFIFTFFPAILLFYGFIRSRNPSKRQSYGLVLTTIGSIETILFVTLLINAGVEDPFLLTWVTISFVLGLATWVTGIIGLIRPPLSTNGLQK